MDKNEPQSVMLFFKPHDELPFIFTLVWINPICKVNVRFTGWKPISTAGNSQALQAPCPGFRGWVFAGFGGYFVLSVFRIQFRWSEVQFTRYCDLRVFIYLYWQQFKISYCQTVINFSCWWFWSCLHGVSRILHLGRVQVLKVLNQRSWQLGAQVKVRTTKTEQQFPHQFPSLPSSTASILPIGGSPPAQN